MKTYDEQKQEAVGIPTEKLFELWTLMQRIRKVELKIEDEYPKDQMKTPVHLAIGEEAVSAALGLQLTREDFVFSNHRSHGHYLAKGGDLKAMMAEMYCKETGCAKGRGGSMHLIDKSVGHPGSSAIVGGSISHAVGAALASKMLKKNFVAVSFFGDAASEQGVFFESMSLAALKKVPVIFVCENNAYSVFSHISARQPNPDVVMRPRAFDIPALQVDGMDAVDMYLKAKQAVEHARAGKGPFLLDCLVQRWRGHAGAGDPIRDKYRRSEELSDVFWRDPIKDLTQLLLQDRAVPTEKFDAVNVGLDAEIAAAFRYAEESPLPKKEDLLKYLYS